MAPPLLHFVTLSYIPVTVIVSSFQNPIYSRRARFPYRRVPTAFGGESAFPWWLSGLPDSDTSTSEYSQQQKRNAQDSPDSTVFSRNYAIVTRLAARQYDKQGASKPSSRYYTTRKTACDSITVTTEGVVGDYNHYRTIALDSTPNRAISILTSDVMTALQGASFSACSDGDLGENVLIQGMNFNDIHVGQQYLLGSTVVVQVTEPMIPCANLCKLPFINDDKLAPKERIARCQALLDFLDRPGDGFRGWYAKVIVSGDISVGDDFRVVEGE